MWSNIRKYTYGWFVDLFKSKEQGLDPKKIAAVVAQVKKKKTKAERKKLAQAQRKERRRKRGK